MQSCEYWQERIEAYLDGGLADDEKQNFLTHISSCSECREALELAKAVRSALTELPAIDVPDDFCDKLHEKLKKEQEKRRAVITYSRRCAMLAACVVIAVAVNAGNLQDYFDKSNNEPALPDSAEVIQQTENIQSAATEEVSDDIIQATDTPEIKTGEKVKSTPTKDKKIENKTQSVAPAVTEQPETAQEAVPQAAPQTEMASAVAEPVEEVNQKQENEGAKSARTAMEDDTSDTGTPLPETALFSAQAYEGADADAQMGGHEDQAVSGNSEMYSAGVSSSSADENSGGGGGSSSASPMVKSSSAAAGSISVSADNISAARSIADKYAAAEGGIYNMSKAYFEQFKKELEQKGISYNDNAVRGEAVSFSIIEY